MLFECYGKLQDKFQFATVLLWYDIHVRVFFVRTRGTYCIPGKVTAHKRHTLNHHRIIIALEVLPVFVKMSLLTEIEYTSL